MAVMNDDAVIFVHNILHIRSRMDLDSFLESRPRDLLNRLGHRLYSINLELLIELTIIWSVTVYRMMPFPYSKYLEYREKYIVKTREQFRNCIMTHPAYQQDSSNPVFNEKNHVHTPESPSIRYRTSYHSPPLLWYLLQEITTIQRSPMPMC